MRLRTKIFLRFAIVVFFFILSGPVFAQLQTDSNKVRTKVGNPPATVEGQWPTTGILTQGPLGGTDHKTRIYDISGGQALDIGNFLGTYSFI